MSMFTPMFWYWNDVMGCWATPPVAIGENVVPGKGICSAQLARGGGQWRVGERPCVAVALQQAVIERRQIGEDDVRLRQVAEVLERQVVAVGVGDALNTCRGGRGPRELGGRHP